MTKGKKSKPIINKKSNDFFIVGIGASAGGLGSFEAFFSGIPTDTDLNMAFVLVQHLDPKHKSLLSSLIQQYTKMKVYEVEDGMKVQVNCVYIIPPNYDMHLSHDVLKLDRITPQKNQHLPIDLFFHSLAKEKQDKAIAIILSGTGHDGTKGVKSIKDSGGVVLVQSLESAEFDGMPKSVIDTGLADDTLSPREMPLELLSYAQGRKKSKAVSNLLTHDEDTLKKIFMLLQNQTSHDFSMYKQSTIGRRIERRLVVNKIETLEEYYKYLQRSKKEVKTLFNDLLIGVTSFFRDEEVFLSLQKNVIPKLFSDKSSDETIRVWVSGCSTGEEAYSIAILIMEHMQKTNKNHRVQIFATDIDPRAIATARTGRYPLDIATNISQKRLQNYFVKDTQSDTYKVHKNIRDMLIFSVHDVIKDPPFSKLDFISCRNLLIYMNLELQQKLISLFHYALNPEGVLLLGNSETLGELSDIYTAIDAKSKIFKSQKSLQNNTKIITSRPLSTNHIYEPAELINKVHTGVKLPLRELTENAILEQIAPAAVLINEQGDILYIHGRAGMYLELPSGETDTNNILKMAREGLQKDLMLAFHKAKSKKQIVHVYGLKMKSNHETITLDITIRAVNLGSSLQPKPPLYLVLLKEDTYLAQETPKEEFALSPLEPEKMTKSQESQRIESLKQELQLQKEFLQDANEKLETSNEELKSYNEEIQSMNEELQSTNEELETSKEELQSVNEELSTVNSELNTKVTDLSRSNNDMNNLLAGTGIGTIFVDHDLNILRFTPAVTRIINLIASDVGRPVGHIVSNMKTYNSLVEDIENVLETLIPKEIEVMTSDEKTYLMRIQPYRTLENVIEGAVISFVDITEIQLIRERLDKANELSRLAVVVRDSSDAIIVENLDGKIIAWNPGAQRLYGWSEEEALQMTSKQRIPKELQEKDTEQMKKLSHSNTLETYKTKRLSKDGSIIEIHIIASALITESGNIYAFTTTERPIKR
jgi:two-component system, chemotaxis family, CheB/CheR fusion protein